MIVNLKFEFNDPHPSITYPQIIIKIFVKINSFSIIYFDIIIIHLLDDKALICKQYPLSCDNNNGRFGWQIISLIFF
jgi:hypothetical protein